MLGSEKPSSVIHAVGGTITKRNTVITPLLVTDFVLVILFVALFIINQSSFYTLCAFILFVICVIATLLAYIYFAKHAPHMLSSESVQKMGMLLNLGDDSKQLSPEETLSLKPIENPKLRTKKITGGKL